MITTSPSARVWEHAYHLKHQNRRLDCGAAFYNVCCLANVARLYATARG